MTEASSVKAGRKPRLVAVIASGAAFHRALRLPRPPDLFELRLDALHPILPEIERALGNLPAPLVITARHPAEGGEHDLSPANRRELLLRFLPHAAFVDVELRAITELREVLESACARRVKLILSVHEMDQPLDAPRFRRFLKSAQIHSADIFKIVTRTDTPNEAARLLEFFQAHKNSISISAMGAGRCGGEARLQLARAGSVLNYVHLGAARVTGQLSLTEMRERLLSHRAA